MKAIFTAMLPRLNVLWGVGGGGVCREGPNVPCHMCLGMCAEKALMFRVFGYVCRESLSVPCVWVCVQRKS